MSRTVPGGRASERPLSQLGDEELVVGLRAASEAHFNELYVRYFKRVYHFTALRVSNRADAEEVVQETFAAVFRSIAAFRGDSALLTWIFGIARNTINNHLRRARLEAERLETLDAQAVSPSPSLAACGPDDQLALRRTVGAIQAQLASVSEWQLDVFRLRHEENLTIREIARRTHRTADAIRSALYRVKRILMDAVDSQRAGESGRSRRWSPA